MPTITVIKFEGSEDEIARFLAQNGYSSSTSQTAPAKAPSQTSGMWGDVARMFEKHVSETAASGRPAQKNAMVAWLRAGGSIELTKLWHAAGVKTQHDYAGVGGSLTKNLVKARGPKQWYTWHRNRTGEWIYEIIPELREPLKDAFGLK
jgi:hypothetical protein